MEPRAQGPTCAACGFDERRPPEAPLALPLRTRLNDQYLVGRVLGQGGFGITYIARDLNLDLKVAVKEFLPRDFASRATGGVQVAPFGGDTREHFEWGLARFLDEARAVARFQHHPGIVSVLNFFRANGTGYLVMAYLEGLTLQRYVDEQGGRISHELAVRIVTPVMDALRELHQASLLHRDISPDNIYITRTKQVKILDFGAARYALGEHSRSLSVVLKPGFAPEEQYRAKGHQGPWTDVYAVGATLYRVITGVVPQDALQRLEQDRLAAPRTLGVSVPPAAERALLKALAVRAEGRFQSVAEFQQALAGLPAAAERMPPAPAPRPKPPGPLPVGSPRTVTLRGAGAVVGLLAGGLGLLTSLLLLISVFGRDPWLDALPILRALNGLAALPGIAGGALLALSAVQQLRRDPQGRNLARAGALVQGLVFALWSLAWLLVALLSGRFWSASFGAKAGLLFGILLLGGLNAGSAFLALALTLQRRREETLTQ